MLAQATRKPEFRRPPADIAVLLESMPGNGNLIDQ